jgi:hypothetical protein
VRCTLYGFPKPYINLSSLVYHVETGVEQPRVFFFFFFTRSISPLVYYYKFGERFGHIFIHFGWADRTLQQFGKGKSEIGSLV